MISTTDVAAYIKTELGDDILGPGSVELDTPGNIVNTVMAKALRHFNRLVGLRRYGTMSLVVGIQRYPMTNEQIGQGILEVDPPRYAGGLQIDEFRILEQTYAPSLDMSVYYAIRANLELLRKSTASDFTWEVRYEDVDPITLAVSTAPDAQRRPILYISPSPREGATASYTFIANLTDVSDIPYEWEQWVLDVCLAESKSIIGRARRRFNADLAQDGTALVNEGADELKELLRRAERAGVIGLSLRQA